MTEHNFCYVLFFQVPELNVGYSDIKDTIIMGADVVLPLKEYINILVSLLKTQEHKIYFRRSFVIYLAVNLEFRRYKVISVNRCLADDFHCHFYFFT